MDQEPKPLEPGSVKERIATTFFEVAKLPAHAPVARGWEIFLSVVTGIVLGLVGIGILYVWARVYIKTDGAAASWIIFVMGVGFVGWGGNTASRQFAGGALSALISPIRKIAAIVRGSKEAGP